MRAKIHQLPSRASVIDSTARGPPPLKKPKHAVSRAKRRWQLVQRHVHLFAASLACPSLTKATSILVEATLATTDPTLSWQTMMAPLEALVMASFRTPHVRLHVVVPIASRHNAPAIFTFDGRRLINASKFVVSGDSAIRHVLERRKPLHLPTTATIQASTVKLMDDVVPSPGIHSLVCVPFVVDATSGHGAAALFVEVFNAGCGGLASAAWCAAAEDPTTTHGLAGVCHIVAGLLRHCPQPLVLASIPRRVGRNLVHLVKVLVTLVTRVSRCRVFAIDEDARTLFCRFPASRDAFTIGSGTNASIELAASARRVVHASSAIDAPLQRPLAAPIDRLSSRVCIPMVVPDTVHAIGVLDVAKTNGSFFTPSEVCVCESLAAHFAAALQEERSAHAVTASLNHMRILDDVSALSLDSMASSTSMQSTEAVVARALHASTCHIRWRCRADSPTSEQPPHALTAIQTKQLVNVHEAALPDGTRGAALAVPILSDRNAVLGIVCATHKHFDAIKPYFDSCDDRLAQFIARTLAAKRLAHDAAQRENALAALLQRMASPTLPERPLAETLVDIELSMAKILGADLVTVLVVEGTTLVSHIQNNGECIRDGLATSVASTAAPLLLPSAGIPCVRRHRAFHPVIDQGTAAVASVPIFAPHAPSQVLGVLHAVHTHGTWGNWPPPMAFLAGDIDTLEAVSASITVLVERLAMEQLLFSIRTRRTMSEDDKSLDDDVGADVSVASRQCFHQAIQALVDSCTRQDDATPPRFHVHPPATPPLAHRPPDTSLADELKLWTFDPFQAAWPKDVLVDHAVAIFQEFSLHQHFQMDRPTLRRFVAAVRDQYRDVPYHNFLHAFTTLHVTFLIVLAQSPPAPDAQTLLERRDVLALFIGAMCHDMNHNGRTNDFHIKTRTATAMLYNDQSVLENMHAAHCFDTLRRPGHNVLEHASCGDYMFIRKAIIRVILATDMGVHASMIQQLSERFHRDVFHPDKDKELLLNAIVHAADIANPALATPLHARWSNALMEEFNAQYEEEIAVGVAPNAYMSAKIDSPDQARMNMRFIDLFCLPLWQHMACFLHGLDGCMDNIRANRAYWAIKADDSTTVT